MDVHNLGFEVLTVSQPGVDGLRRIGRFHCTGCEAQLDLAITNKIAPDFLAGKAKQKGWLADADKANVAKCPQCRPPKPKDAKMTVTPIKPPAAPTASEQRTRIRGLLDKHFDDSIGTYLDDMSDEKIAEAVNAPRSLVERVRESAYGPILVSPEIAALRAELAAFRVDLEDRRSALAEQRIVLDRTEAGLIAMESRLEKLTQKRVA